MSWMTVKVDKTRGADAFWFGVRSELVAELRDPQAESEAMAIAEFATIRDNADLRVKRGLR